MTISMTEKQLKKLVDTAVIGVLKNLGFDEKGNRVNSPSARHFTPYFRHFQRLSNLPVTLWWPT